MDLKDIKELMRFFDKTGLTELEIDDGDTSLYLSKNSSAVYSVAQPMPQQPVQPMMPAPAAEAPSAQLPAPAQNAQPESGNIIESPMIGTYYSAPSPGAESFVQVGDIVEKGQTLCIIEAMKIMNSIEAEYRCKIQKIFIENGKPVEFGQDLFLVEPM